MKCRYCGTECEEKFRFCSVCGKEIVKTETDRVENYDALIRRARKIVEEFQHYPIMPEGDLSLGYIKAVFKYNPLFVLDDLKAYLMKTLLEVTEYKHDESLLIPIIEETYGKQEKRHKQRILQTLLEEYKQVMKCFRYQYHYYMDLRPDETLAFYYSYSIFYIARDLQNIPAMFAARVGLTALRNFSCEKNTTPFMGIGATGKMLELSEFAEDRVLYNKLIGMIEQEIEHSDDEATKQKLREAKKEESKGCYIATCVYGSYDCPQVWVLRRFRDFYLDKTRFGKILIRIYYTVSPKIVKIFGKSGEFRSVFRCVLDWIVRKLHSRGYQDSAYDDKMY